VRTVTRILGATVFALVASSAQALHVFACEPEWASLTQALHPSARVFSATTHLQDPHHVEARPSLIARLRQADLAVCTGAGLESGWLPMLQERSGNAAVQNGAPGMFFASSTVRLIQQHEGLVTPFSGDVHPEGNPHIQLDPHRLLTVAQALRDRLIQLDPQAAGAIRDRYAAFHRDLASRIAVWEKQTSHLKGKTIATQHSSFGYLWEWLQMHVTIDLEPKPGSPPTPAHLNRVRDTLRTSPVAAIVIAQHHDQRPAQWLSRQFPERGPPLIIIPGTTPDDSSRGLLTWLDLVVGSLVKSIR
jgi:zinc/manganese transport system substrate-binding protein